MTDWTSSEIPDDTSIWRYLDLPRFASTLATGRLWFARLDQQEDPYEGFCKAVPLEVPLDDCGPKLITTEDQDGTRKISNLEMLSCISDIAAENYKAASTRLYVNSWSLADESMAMWEIYGSRACGVAMKSSVGRYRQSAKFVPPRSQYALDCVKYDRDITSSSDTQLDCRLGTILVPGPDLWTKTLKVAFHKRACYRHEQEWRAALYLDTQPEDGIALEFDLDQLIDAVYVGPRSKPFLRDVVDWIMHRSGLSTRSKPSLLLCPP